MRTVVLAALACAGLFTGCAEDSSTGVSGSRDVAIEFTAVMGEENYICGKTYKKIGAAEHEYQISDVRMFVSNISVTVEQEAAETLRLDEDGLWQHDNIALLAFGHNCDDSTPKEINKTVRGSMALFPDQIVEQVCFDLGLPFDMNHINSGTAPSPLNVSGMFWGWQGGYKFLRIDGVGTEVTPSKEEGEDPVRVSQGFNVHLGSTGCTSEDKLLAPEEECAYPNLPRICLDINSDTHQIQLDIKELLAKVAVAKNTTNTPPGCMSANSDPECRQIIPALGLDFTYTPSASEQEIFKKDDERLKKVFSVVEKDEE